jgi:hypothetical protein
MCGEASENILLDNPQQRGVNRLPARRMQVSAARAQMVTRSKESRERGGLGGNDGIGTGEAAEKMIAHLPGARAGCNAFERVSAVEPNIDTAAPGGVDLGAECLASASWGLRQLACGCSMCPRKALCSAHAV